MGERTTRAGGMKAESGSPPSASGRKREGGPPASQTPTVLSRLAAILALAVLMAGGAYLAHALTRDWQADLVLSAGEDADRAPTPPPETDADVDSEAVTAMMAALSGFAESAEGDSPSRRRLARELAEHLAGGTAAPDLLPPPRGARRLLGVAGGVIFYRLADGDPALRAAQAARHYRTALAANGWTVMADDERQPRRPDGQLDGRTSYLLMASRDRQVVSVFIHYRGGAARALVRTLQE